jgi:hypothetical protein
MNGWRLGGTPHAPLPPSTWGGKGQIQALGELLRRKKLEAKRWWDLVRKSLLPREDEENGSISLGWRVVAESGIFPRIIPLTVLPLIMTSQHTVSV